MAVLDASFQVALIRSSDPHHAAARAWYRQSLIDGLPLSAPWLFVAEVAAAIRRGMDDSSLARESLGRILDEQRVELAIVDAALATSAAEIAAAHGIRGCDAVYVALAQARAEPLISFDRQQLERAGAIVEMRRP